VIPPWLIPEPSPDPRKPNLLVYSSCHAFGILRYFNEHRPEIRQQYNVSAILIHVAMEDLNARLSNRLIQSFCEADALLYHPLIDAKWDGWRAEQQLLKPSCVRVSMESPQASCFWPFVEGPILGEMPVQVMCGSGASATEIKATFDSGAMQCYFRERFSADTERMSRREVHSDAKSANFVAKNYTRVKMFFTENHPTMPVLGWMTDQFLARLGHPMMGEEHALGLPPDTLPGENHFPETSYEWDYYGFSYPRRYEANMGGMKHYHAVIDRICAR
jgi:hypothetical protein